MPEKTKIYFASDMHLGMHPLPESRLREKRIVEWLNSVQEDMAELWLLGDIFDYWFEYRKVVPRGFLRFLGKLSELADSGVKIYMISGNHDIWLFDYFPEELGIEVHHHHVIKEYGSTRFYLAHGDGLNKKDRAYLFLRSIFRNKYLQWFYARIHPNASAAFAQWWSRKSRYGNIYSYPVENFDEEDQVRFAHAKATETPDIDYFVFGHRHLPYNIPLNAKARVACLGDWIVNYTYGVYDGKEFRLEKFKSEQV